MVKAGRLVTGCACHIVERNSLFVDTWTGIDANIEPAVEAGTCETGAGKPATSMSGPSQLRRRC